jgi:hypothetical protein
VPLFHKTIPGQSRDLLLVAGEEFNLRRQSQSR